MDGLGILIPLAGIICGTTLVGFVLSKIFGLIKAWINRNQHSYNDETFNRLARNFAQHKKDTDRRLQNLEAIVVDEGRSPSEKTLEQPHNSIEIEEDKKEEKTGTGNNSLKNMLRE